LNKTFLFLLLPLLAPGGGLRAADKHPLFQSHDVLKAVITAPISQAYAQRHKDVRIYFPGQWTYIDEESQTQRLQVSIRTRGHFRREYCHRPPLQLNFKKSEVKGTLFAGQNKLKLVAPCKEGSRYQQFVILEYLAYRSLEIITDYSYATRLVRLSYVDRDEKRDPWTDIAFVLEDDSDMARRLGMDRMHLESVGYADLDHPKTALVQLFQFMIANNDYSILRARGDEDCCHNIDVLGKEGSTTGFIPIPFDFDMSGTVNAGYAAPPSQVPVRDVRNRYFYGLCQSPEIFDEAIAHVQSKREEILALYANSAELDDKTKAKALEYVEEYYAILDSPELRTKEIFDRCRGRDLMEKMFEASKVSTSDPSDQI